MIPILLLLLIIVLNTIGCTSIEYLVEKCESQQGHPILLVNEDITEIKGVRCELHRI